jgi:hypothetical protein
VRKHDRILSALAFALLALVAELTGRSLTHRVDVGRHVGTPRYASADYYPILLAAVKLGVALLLARLLWRFVRALATARAGRRLGPPRTVVPTRRPRLRVELSPRLWLAFFLLTAGFYLAQTDAEELSAGRWPLLAPWLHSSALPVFAVLAVLVAIVWRAVSTWLSDFESYAEALAARAGRLASDDPPSHSFWLNWGLPPRRLFGLAFEVRPPPLRA